VRHLAGFRQIGHLGTLDPLATGVLVLCSAGPRAGAVLRRAPQAIEAGFRFGSRQIRTIPTAKRRGQTPRRRWMRGRSKFAAGAHRAVRTNAAVVFREESERAPRVTSWRRKNRLSTEAPRNPDLRIQTGRFEGSIARFCHRVLSGHLRPVRWAHEMGQKLGFGAHPGGNHAPRRRRIFAWNKPITLEGTCRKPKLGPKFADCLIPSLKRKPAVRNGG